MADEQDRPDEKPDTAAARSTAVGRGVPSARRRSAPDQEGAAGQGRQEGGEERSGQGRQQGRRPPKEGGRDDTGSEGTSQGAIADHRVASGRQW